MKIIAFILDPPVIERILSHIGEPIEPPHILPARGPPQAELVIALRWERSEQSSIRTQHRIGGPRWTRLRV